MKLHSLSKKIVTAVATVALLAVPLATTPLATAAPAAAVQKGATKGWNKFYWGSATAGFQVEGSNYDSNWLRYINRESKKDPTKVNPVKNATDFRHRYKEDLGNAAWMGLNTFRISMEWSRIEPKKGQWNWKEIHYYDDVIKTMRKHGMTPMITTVHYVYPGWVQDQGGFMNKTTLQDYQRFVNFLAKRYSGNGTMWITFNEPLVFFGHEVEIGNITRADMAPFMKNVQAAHKIAYNTIKKYDKRARIGSNEAYLPFVTSAADQFFFKPVEKELDFVGIDYYYTVALSNLSAIYGATSQFDKIDPQPEGIYFAIQHFSEAFPDKPVYIVENGIPSYNGHRPDGFTKGDWLNDTVFWIQRAVADGYPVVGYNYWSITDNYEWGQYDSRFGLYTVDVLKDPALKRKPTDGPAAFRQITKNGGVPQNYQLKSPLRFCPLSEGLRSCVNPPRVYGPRAILK